MEEIFEPHLAQLKRVEASAQHLHFPTQEDFAYEDMEALCSALRTLATDSNKYRAKIDRRRQRSIFRAVLQFVEVCVCESMNIPLKICPHQKERASQVQWHTTVIPALREAEIRGSL